MHDPLDGLDSFVALGDSFTEGLDDLGPDGVFRGWADLVAAELATRQPRLRYANLAVRGRRLAHIVDQQLPLVEGMRPALVTVAAGGNDLLGGRVDVDALAVEAHRLLERLVATAATVVVFTGPDVRGRLPLGRVVAARAQRYNAAVARSAAELGAVVVDLWQLPGLERDEMWAPDRLHLSAAGHALVAAAVLAALGVDREPAELGPLVVRRVPWLAARRDDLAWSRRYLLPWLGRRLRGRSTGDLVEPKRPVLTLVVGGEEPAAS